MGIKASQAEEAQAKLSGTGWNQMRNRIAQMNAKLRMETNEGEGVRLHLEIPHQQANR